MVDFITPSNIDIRANDAIASSTARANGQLFFNTTSNSLHVYDGFSIGGYKTSLTAYSPAYRFQGESYGFTAGGYTASPTVNILSNFIGRISFVSDANQSDFSDLSVYRKNMAGTSSTTSGYTIGGRYRPTPSNPAVFFTNQIEKFSFVSSSVGVVSASNADGIDDPSGHSSESYGYAVGGQTPVEAYSTAIYQFSHSSNADSTDIGELSTGWRRGTSNSADDYGYTAAGQLSPVPTTYTNTIQKFPFSTSSTSTNVGNLVVTRSSLASSSSSTHGYATGGVDTFPGSSTQHNEIEKWPFSSDTSATDIGNLVRAVRTSQGVSSTFYGYTTGGNPGTVLSADFIEKYPFSSDTDSVDIGNLTVPVQEGTGHQV